MRSLTHTRDGYLYQLPEQTGGLKSGGAAHPADGPSWDGQPPWPPAPSAGLQTAKKQTLSPSWTIIAREAPFDEFERS